MPENSKLDSVFRKSLRLQVLQLIEYCFTYLFKFNREMFGDLEMTP